MPAQALTKRQQRFINAYLSNGFNATQAAITAGYSRDTARQQACRLLKHEAISPRVSAFLDASSMRVSEVLARLTAQARGDIGALWDENTGRVNWQQARGAGLTGLIKTTQHKVRRKTLKDSSIIEVTIDELELHNPLIALDMLLRYHMKTAAARRLA